VTSLGSRALFALSILLVPMPVLAQARLEADGSELVLVREDGRTLRSKELVGATLHVGGAEILVASVEEDPRAVGGRVWLHRFLVRQRDGGTRDYCDPDADGLRAGFPLPDGRGGFELTCTNGAKAKCVRWGYRPWDERPGGPPLRALHRACIHMTRADYGGDGATATRDGTRIDLYDRFGIQQANYEFPLAFESAWGVDGALCVARPRIAELLSLDDLARRYQSLVGRLGPTACTEEIARRDPAAILFTRSARAD
jgi:hypothetical protein